MEVALVDLASETWNTSAASLPIACSIGCDTSTDRLDRYLVSSQELGEPRRYVGSSVASEGKDMEIENLIHQAEPSLTLSALLDPCVAYAHLLA